MIEQFDDENNIHRHQNHSNYHPNEIEILDITGDQVPNRTAAEEMEADDEPYKYIPGAGHDSMVPTQGEEDFDEDYQQDYIEDEEDYERDDEDDNFEHQFPHSPDNTYNDYQDEYNNQSFETGPMGTEEDEIDIPPIPSAAELYPRLKSTKLRMICRLPYSYLFLGSGCQSITPIIFIVIVCSGYHFFNSMIVCQELSMLNTFVRVLVAAFVLNMVKVAFTNPGHIKRERPKNPLPDSYYHCKKCWITKREARERGIVHCNDCDVCVYGYDHHCGVLGNCIGARNLWNFNLMIGLFMLTVITFYVSLFLAMWKCGVAGLTPKGAAGMKGHGHHSGGVLPVLSGTRTGHH